MAKTIMEESKTNLNKRILKALGIFGGTQSIQIICSFVRNKFAAVLLGTEGIGLLAVFNNALDLLTSSTQLSIRQSALRDVTKADTADKLHRIAYIVLRWSWLLGVVGAIITLHLGSASILLAIKITLCTFPCFPWPFFCVRYRVAGK